MIFGRVRGYMPRVSLVLPGMRGPLSVEFIVDTGFEGDLSVGHDRPFRDGLDDIFDLGGELVRRAGGRR